MTGAQHLLHLDIQDRRRPSIAMLTAASPAPQDLDTSKAWRASFWNFVCVDYMVSYAAGQKTRLDTSDLKLWGAAGLTLLDTEGRIVPELLKHQRGCPRRKMTEDMACKTLLWLLLDALNYVASDKETAIPMQHMPQSPHGAEGPAPQTIWWARMKQLIEVWWDSKPESFQPCLRSSKPRLYRAERAIGASDNITVTSRNSPALETTFHELFYSTSMGATALLLYHFTNILLLLHRPASHEHFKSQGSAQRLKAYRQFSSQIEHHAQEICAIALGKPQEAVQAQLLQPLFLAGLCLETVEQQATLADLLMGVQKSTGCSTESRLMQLKEEWGWKQVV